MVERVIKGSTRQAKSMSNTYTVIYKSIDRFDIIVTNNP